MMASSSSLIPQRSSIGPSLQASKWQTCRLLIDTTEMKDLLEILGDFWWIQISGLIPVGNEMIDKASFLEVYHSYVTSLKQGKLPVDAHTRAYFSSIWTNTLEALYVVPMQGERCLVKVYKPVIQLQAHRFDYSFADGKFRSMVLGSESIQWGIQFSYPLLYQDENLQVFFVKPGSQFPNTALFKKLQQWVRSYTIATPFEIEGKRVNVPIRLGKECLQWINSHPQLQIKGLRVIDV